jgi:hypothetical protein
VLINLPSPPLPPSRRNKECLSLGCDEVPLFWGRTPVDMYRDFVDAFADTFDYLFGAHGCEVAGRGHTGWQLCGVRPQPWSLVTLDLPFNPLGAPLGIGC